MDSRKQGKLQWLQNKSPTNVDNLNNIRQETSKTLKNKEGVLERGINEPERSRKKILETYRVIN
jgi:hypothetical protein